MLPWRGAEKWYRLRSGAAAQPLGTVAQVKLVETYLKRVKVLAPRATAVLRSNYVPREGRGFRYSYDSTLRQEPSIPTYRLGWQSSYRNNILTRTTKPRGTFLKFSAT